MFRKEQLADDFAVEDAPSVVSSDEFGDARIVWFR
jgi:hypothetical protein